MLELNHGDTTVLTKLFRHNTWANLTLLDFCAGLNDEWLDVKAVGGYGSIRATLMHIVGSEVDYVNLATEKVPAVPLPKGEFPGFPALRDAVRWAGDEWIQLALTAHADTIVRTKRPEEPIYEYPLAGLIVQILDHSTWHRAQVSAIIRHLGLVPPALSGWRYMRELGEFLESPSGAEEQ